MIPAVCHPDKPALARGLCKECYVREYKAGTHVLHPLAVRKGVPKPPPSKPRKNAIVISPEGTRFCTACQSERPALGFKSAWCKVCNAASRKRWRERNPGYKGRWRRENPELHALHQRRAHLKRRYGMTIEDYEVLLVAQNGSCAICSSAPNGSDLDVDHDHITGNVRGLLCNKCNLAIGALGDTADSVRKALRYLEGA